MDRNVIRNIVNHYARECNVLDHKNDLMKLIETTAISRFIYLDILVWLKCF